MGERVCGSREYHSLSSILFDISYIGHRGVQQRGHLLNVLEKIRNERLRSVFAGCLLIFLFSFFFRKILILAFSFSSLLSNLEEKSFLFLRIFCCCSSV